MLTEEFAHHFADEWLAAWNSHDLDRILAHYTDDFRFSSPLIAKVMDDGCGELIGKPLVREYWRRALDNFPDLHFELKSVFAGVGSVVIAYQSVQNLQAAEWFEFDNGGRVTRAGAHYS